jgi:hypothetical protein
MDLDPGSALLTRKVYLITLKEKIAETLGNVRLVSKIDTSPSTQFLHRNPKGRIRIRLNVKRPMRIHREVLVILKSRVVDSDPHGSALI